LSTQKKMRLSDGNARTLLIELAQIDAELVRLELEVKLKEKRFQKQQERVDAIRQAVTVLENYE